MSACLRPDSKRAQRRFLPNTAAADGSTPRVRGAFRAVVVIAIRSRFVGQALRNMLAVLEKGWIEMEFDAAATPLHEAFAASRRYRVGAIHNPDSSSTEVHNLGRKLRHF